ncbi:type I-F CRISPR-associated protein Csy3 [Selenomonas sp. TAMA-11512]|uniref:type I-F CRISPR-associated protein Csy3 n=1 Tax=Selenomonas sp. TAMA-11512 TaxID=3095337 RepID=UPI0030882BAD|nr:type I-F CRISPR-associated protein Csy3 [Selenomonas sp. TAMA-11512]
MAKKQEQEKEIPSVLAYEKKLVVSDGCMHGTTWEKRHAKSTPLAIVEKSVRGTISNRLPDAVQNNPAKINAKVENPNPQRVDACALDMHQDTLKVAFTIKVLSGIESPSACNNAKFQQKYKGVAKKYIEKYGFSELAFRYAQNIANARFLWRNRLGAEEIEVVVKAWVQEWKQDADGRALVPNGRAEEKTWVFNAYDYSLRDFDNPGDTEELAGLIAEALCGKRGHVYIEVEAYAKLGTGQEVYPSEELVFNASKGKGDKGKVLYSVQGIAAMHSQKLSNAIRTIDTWYPDYADAENGVGPIAIEPYGAVTNLGKAFRLPQEKKDFYTLFDSYALGEGLNRKEDEHYVMAVLIRGGVFGKGK